jgi:AraC-like DNA-binding protein
MSEKPFKKTPLARTFNVTSAITILCYELSPNYSNEGERHNFWEMIYIDRGHVIIQNDVDSFVLHQGELMFHKPNSFHKVACDGSNSSSVFIISFDCKSPAMKLLVGRIFAITNHQTKIIKRLIDECLGTFALSEYPLTKLEAAPIGGAQLVKNYLEELLIFLARDEGISNHHPDSIPERMHNVDNLAQKIEEYLSLHLRGKVSLDEISARFHYGKSSLCDIFKRTYGETIINYHTKLKVEAAKRHIFEKKMTISEVAEHLGFESPEYFSRTFKKITGISPRAFRTSLISANTVYLENELVLNK